MIIPIVLKLFTELFHTNAIQILACAKQQSGVDNISCTKMATVSA